MPTTDRDIVIAALQDYEQKCNRCARLADRVRKPDERAEERADGDGPAEEEEDDL